MGRPFRARRSAIEVRLGGHERETLASLLGQLDDLLDDGQAVPADPLADLLGFDLRMPGEGPAVAEPEDPALARLLPSGSRDDPEAAQEYRRLTERGLRARKRADAQAAAAALRRPEPVLLDPGEARSLLTALTDLRLVLAERLGVRTEEDAEAMHRALRHHMLQSLRGRARPGGPDQAADSADQPGAEDAGEVGGDAWAMAAGLYDALTWWQENLVHALART